MAWTSRRTYVTGEYIPSSVVNRLSQEVESYTQQVSAKDKLIQNAMDCGLVAIVTDDGRVYLDNPHAYENGRLQRENSRLQEENRRLRAENHWLRTDGSQKYDWQSDSAAWGFSEN